MLGARRSKTLQNHAAFGHTKKSAGMAARNFFIQQTISFLHAATGPQRRASRLAWKRQSPVPVREQECFCLDSGGVGALTSRSTLPAGGVDSQWQGPKKFLAGASYLGSGCDSSAVARESHCLGLPLACQFTRCGGEFHAEEPQKDTCPFMGVTHYSRKDSYDE